MKSAVTQHIKTEKHSTFVHRKNKMKRKSQQLITNVPEKFMFAKVLCKTLLKFNIPLEKWGNKHLRLFNEKYNN